MKRRTIIRLILTGIILLILVNIGWELIWFHLQPKVVGQPIQIPWDKILLGGFKEINSSVTKAISAAMLTLAWIYLIKPVINPEIIEALKEPQNPVIVEAVATKPVVMGVPMDVHEEVVTERDAWRKYGKKMNAYILSRDHADKRLEARTTMLRVTIGTVFALGLVVFLVGSLSGKFVPEGSSLGADASRKLTIATTAREAAKKAAATADKTPALPKPLKVQATRKATDAENVANAAEVAAVAAEKVAEDEVRPRLVNHMRNLSAAYALCGLILGWFVWRVPSDTKIRHAWRAAGISALTLNFSWLCLALPNVTNGSFQRSVGLLPHDDLLAWILVFRLIISPAICICASAVTYFVIASARLGHPQAR